MGATGWSAAEILPLTSWRQRRPGDHGHDGPSGCATCRPNDPCGAAVLEAAALVGLPTVAFNRGETVRNGAGWFQINAAEDGIRMSTSHAYLHPILGTRTNLEVRTDCWVTEILFDDVAAPPGVRYQRPDLTGYDIVSARREVIVTAGAIDTPKLLMLSGIGPAEHLREIGIPVRVDSPGVGSNLDDHVEGLVFWEASRPMVTTSTQWWEIGLFTTVDEGVDPARPDDALRQRAVRHEHAAPRLPDHRQRILPDAQRDSGPLPRHGPAAVSRDFRDRPRVDPRYFTDPEGYDERIMLTGVRLARKIAEQAPLADWVARELAPGPDATTDDELLDYIHQMPQHRLPPGGDRADGCGRRPDGGARPAAAGQGRVAAAGGRRVGDAEAACGQPEHHGDDDGREVCGPDPEAETLTSRRSWAGTRRSSRCPTSELAELAAGVVAGGASPPARVVADYATHVPDDVWMVRTGQVALRRQQPTAPTIDTVDPGGIFGYTPLLTGGGMDFEARTTAPSTLIRLPGDAGAGPVRQARGTGVPGVVGVERRHRRSARRSRRPPTADRSPSWCTATCCWSRPTPRCATPSCR